MKAAFLNGLVGLTLSLIIGIYALNYSALDVCFFVFSSNLAGLVALLLCLQTDRLPPPIKKWFKGTFRAWCLLVTLYYGILLTLSPDLINLKSLLYLSFPLIFSTGFSIMAFGPIRDWIVRYYQKKDSLTEEKKNQSPKQNFPCFPSDSAVL